MRYSTDEQKKYRSELKNYVKTLRNNGLTFKKIAEKFNQEGKTKLSGAKTKWGTQDINYLAYNAPNGHARRTKTASSKPISKFETLLRETMSEVLDSNLSWNTKLKLVKAFINERTN